jgi:hypothetical protein
VGVGTPMWADAGLNGVSLPGPVFL